MHRKILRYDIWICLVIGFLVSLLAVRIARNFLPDPGEVTIVEHPVEEGGIGGVADESVFRAQSVENLLSHDTFTIVSPGNQYRNRGAGFYRNSAMYAVMLPSGELVAARINMESVRNTDEVYGDGGDSTLPVGRVVYEDLTADEYFIKQIEYAEPLSRRDFYIDMVGEGGTEVIGNDTQMRLDMIQVITVFSVCIILHIIGAKLGIFPYVLPPRKKTGEEDASQTN